MSAENVVNSSTLLQLRENKWKSQTIVSSHPKDSHSVENCHQKHSDFEWKHHSVESIPDWLRTNSYILYGHRPPLYSVRACLWSVFRLHTETGNIWSHIIGCLLFIALSVYEMNYSRNSSLEFMEQLVFGLFFAGVVICMALSSIYHIMCCHSPSLEAFFLRLDFSGIVLIAISHAIPFLYYGFYCSPKIKAIYLTISTVLGILTIFLLMNDKYSQSKYRSIRAKIFATTFSFGLIPIFHFIIANYHKMVEPAYSTAAICLLLMAALYFTGAFIYSQSIPEKYLPGKCDYWFHSHQLFHIIVVMAVIVHYYGFTNLSDYIQKLPKNYCEIQN